MNVNIQLFKFQLMSRVRDFIGQQNHFERMLAKSMDWEFVDQQSKGSCYDYIAPDGAKIEAKFDWDSIKTGNHYLEFGQTSNNGETWVASGFALSEEVADYWVVVNNDWLRVFDVKKLADFLKQNRRELKMVKTKAGVNHNSPGQYSKAYLIPFGILDELALMKIPSPVRRD